MNIIKVQQIEAENKTKKCNVCQEPILFNFLEFHNNEPNASILQTELCRIHLEEHYKTLHRKHTHP